MKLGSLKHPKKRDGEPVVISRDNKTATKVSHLVPSLREAVEEWATAKPQLQKIYDDLNNGKIKESFAVKEEDFHSPLPRAFQWVDGSAFISHIKLVRKARNAPLPPDLLTVPLLYQGGSDTFLAPRDNVPLIDESFGMDFEGEVAVVTDFVPMGTKPEDALKHILLVLIVNDVSLRGLIPAELAQGFGFFQSKPSSAFGPFALTPDELGSAWKEGRIHLPLNSYINGKLFGNPEAGEMHFHFGQIIAHAARTRDLSAGTIIGSGTVSNDDATRGGSCLVEKRMIEQIQTGEAKTSFMKDGDTVKIEMLSEEGQNLFGTIFQKIKKVSL